jgi:Nuclear cap-binding protein subunit 3
MILTQEKPMSDDSTRRPNALLLRGPPIAHLPTKLIFEYVTHFDAKPLGLEWIDDTTCVLLFASSVAATSAFSLLQRTSSELPDERGFVLAKSIPMAFWPPKVRIDASLGKGEGLKGSLLLRWAEVTDVKKRGARNRSEFYRKHGVDVQLGGEVRREDAQEAKRRRREELDDELDAFLRKDSSDEGSRSASPPSKMRADYIEKKGRGKSLLDRTSQMRGYFTDDEDMDSWKTSLETRITSPGSLVGKPRRQPGDGVRGPGRRGAWNDEGDVRSRHGRPRKSQQELDAELDAFLNERE